jgi:hypothetical protein
MSHPSDPSMIGLSVKPRSRRNRKHDTEEPPQATPWMSYEIAPDNGAWRILFHGRRAGRFDSFEAALQRARDLARESAALGRAASVSPEPDAPSSKREFYPARGPAFAGFLAPHEA